MPSNSDPPSVVYVITAVKVRTGETVTLRKVGAAAAAFTVAALRKLGWGTYVEKEDG